MKTILTKVLRWGSQNPILMIILVLIILPFISSYKALATQVIIYSLLTLGYNIMYGYAGLLSFGHAAFFGLGAYSTGIVLIRANGSLLTSIGVGVIVSAIGGLLIGFFSLRRRGIYFALLTLAFAQMLYYIANTWQSLTGGEAGLRNIPWRVLELPGGVVVNIYTPIRLYFFTLLFVILALLILKRVLDSPFGKVLHGIRENEKRARACGYNTGRIKWTAFILSGAISGLAGSLQTVYMHFVNIDQLYWETSGRIVMMALLGGAGTFFGPFIGAGIFLYLEDMISGYTKNWMIFLGPIFVLCVLFFPQGIWGKIKDSIDKITEPQMKRE
jgi:branched-chain amino acid transport system permease protein